MPAWLVTTTTAKPARLSSADGVDAERKEREPLEAIEIARLFDDRAVAVEENGGPHARRGLPGGARPSPMHGVDVDSFHAPVIDRTLAQHAGPAEDRAQDHVGRARRARWPARRSDRRSRSAGTPSAAAMCMAPESFDTNAAQRDTTPTSCRSVGPPDQVDDADAPAAVTILSHAPFRGRRARRPAPGRAVARERRRSPARRARAASAWRDRMPRPARNRRVARPGSTPAAASSAAALCRVDGPRLRSAGAHRRPPARCRGRARARGSTRPGGRVRRGRATPRVSSRPRRSRAISPALGDTAAPRPSRRCRTSCEQQDRVGPRVAQLRGFAGAIDREDLVRRARTYAPRTAARSPASRRRRGCVRRRRAAPPPAPAAPSRHPPASWGADDARRLTCGSRR